jgi:hypothetical protein
MWFLCEREKLIILYGNLMYCLTNIAEGISLQKAPDDIEHLAITVLC